MSKISLKVNPTFFKSPAEFRQWLAEHHAAAQELWVGFYRKASGRPSMSWPESVDEALCFGWIDGIRKSLDDVSYAIRFTPRKPRSVWSAVNINRAEELSRRGRMQPSGRRAFEARVESRSGIYAYEQQSAELDGPYAKKLRQNREAWSFFQAQPASYRKAASWWVLSARREETRVRRLEKLIEDSAAGRRLPQFTRKNEPG